MPVCHYCHKNNLYSSSNICQVKEDIADKRFRGKAHRICGRCLIKYQNKHGVKLTIKTVYWSMNQNV